MYFIILIYIDGILMGKGRDEPETPKSSKEISWLPQ